MATLIGRRYRPSRSARRRRSSGQSRGTSPPQHRPRSPHPGPRRALRGDPRGLVIRPLPCAPPARRGRPSPRWPNARTPPRPPHPRLAAVLEGNRTGPESAQSDLDEAWEIAERGPMKLHMADILLHRARLFFREAKYPWGSPPPIPPPRASSSSNAATGGARRSWRMPSGRSAGAEVNPLLRKGFVKGEVGGSALARGACPLHR